MLYNMLKNQTDKICLEAVKKYGLALQYVNDKKLFIKIKNDGEN